MSTHTRISQVLLMGALTIALSAPANAEHTFSVERSGVALQIGNAPFSAFYYYEEQSAPRFAPQPTHWRLPPPAVVSGYCRDERHGSRHNHVHEHRPEHRHGHGHGQEFRPRQERFEPARRYREVEIYREPIITRYRSRW